MSTNDINTRCTTALRTLEAEGVINSVFAMGQSLVDDSGATAVVVALGPRWQEQDTFWQPQNAAAIGKGMAAFRPGYGLTALCGWTHDLSDPVTAASLIVLVREAWDDPTTHVEWDGEWTVSTTSPADAVGWGATEAEACVAALEAKAREVAP